MSYSLDPNTVKNVIENVKKGKAYDSKQFLYYHLHRNYFNVKSEVNTLRYVRDGVYADNLGHYWQEVSTLKNYYHMPKDNWLGSMFGLATPYSRKFLRDDNVSGIGGEFEMIVRRDGKRVDALTHEAYQETYNFGKTRNTSMHILLDVKTHRNNPNYTFKQNMGKVAIIEKNNP